MHNSMTTQKIDHQTRRCQRLLFSDPVAALWKYDLLDIVGSTADYLTYHGTECNFTPDSQDGHLEFALREQTRIVERILGKR